MEWGRAHWQPSASLWVVQERRSGPDRGCSGSPTKSFPGICTMCEINHFNDGTAEFNSTHPTSYNHGVFLAFSRSVSNGLVSSSPSRIRGCLAA